MDRVKAILKRSEPAKWLFYGDSITHGAVHTEGYRDYAEHFEERVRFELDRRQDIVINTAISGNNTRHLLEDYDWRLGQFKPDVAFVMIGMNDCAEDRNLPIDEFRANMRKLVEQLTSDNIIPVLQTTCPILPGCSPLRQPNFDSYMQVVRDTAEQTACPLIDHLAHWQQQAEPIHYRWMSDTIHPNNFGHLAFAHHLFRALGIFNDAAPTCRLYLPQ